MIYRDLYQSTMGMKSTPFINKLERHVNHLKKMYKDEFDIHLTDNDYKLPMNYLLEKLNAYDLDDKVDTEFLKNLEKNAKRKIRYDMSSLLATHLRNQALNAGDSDITV